MPLAASGGIALFPDHGETPRDAASTPPTSRSTAPRRRAATPFAPVRAGDGGEGLAARARSSATCARRSSAASWSCSTSRGIDLRSRRQVASRGAGALAPPRPRHHPAGRFPRVAEAIGLGTELDRWVIQQACRQAARWRAGRAGVEGRGQRLGRQASQPQLASELRQILQSRPGCTPQASRSSSPSAPSSTPAAKPRSLPAPGRRPRREPRDRRLRQRLFVVRLFAPPARAHDQDRPLLHRADRPEPGRTRPSSRRSSTSATRSASGWSPRASRPGASSTSCARMAATRRRASSSLRRSTRTGGPAARAAGDRRAQPRIDRGPDRARDRAGAPERPRAALSRTP